MLKIGICDDDPTSTACSRSLIESTLDKQQISNYEVIEFHQPDKLYEYLKDTILDVLFVQLEGRYENGISIARRLEEMHAGLQVVFLTEGMQHYSSRIYEAEHLYLVLKGELEYYLPHVFEKLNRKERQGNRQRIMVTSKGRQRIVVIGKILYFERNKRITQIACQEERISTSADLNSLLCAVGSGGFVRCHNSYAINFDYVKEFRRSEFLLTNDDIIPISRRYQPEVRKKFTAWVGCSKIVQ